MNLSHRLQNDLETFRTGWESRVGETIARLIAGDIDDLRDSGILDRAAKPDDQLVDPGTLRDAHDQAFDLGALVARQPAVLTFYRGGWCPYCNLELRGYQALLGAFREAGGQLVAVSPELPDFSLSTIEKNDLQYPVLSDVGGALASALGIRFTLSDAVRPFYEKAGHALPQRNGDGTWALPMPATFVIDAGGRIAAAFVEPDYRRRLEPIDALRALVALRPSRAA